MGEAFFCPQYVNFGGGSCGVVLNSSLLLLLLTIRPTVWFSFLIISYSSSSACFILTFSLSIIISSSYSSAFLFVPGYTFYWCVVSILSLCFLRRRENEMRLTSNFHLCQWINAPDHAASCFDANVFAKRRRRR